MRVVALSVPQDTQLASCWKAMVWTQRLPAQCWRDLGLSIILRLRVNEKLFVREMFIRYLAKKTH